MDGKIVKLHRKPHAKLPERYKELLATYLFTRRLFDYIPDVNTSNLDHEVLPVALAKENMHTFETSDYVKDVGTPERYRAVEDYLARQK